MEVNSQVVGVIKDVNDQDFITMEAVLKEDNYRGHDQLLLGVGVHIKEVSFIANVTNLKDFNIDGEFIIEELEELS